MHLNRQLFVKLQIMSKNEDKQDRHLQRRATVHNSQLSETKAE